MVEIGKYVYPELSGEKREGLSDTKNNAHFMMKHRKRFANRCRWGVLAALVVLGLPASAQWKAGVTVGGTRNSLETTSGYFYDRTYHAAGGFTAGAVVQREFTNWLAVGGELVFLQKNYDTRRSLFYKPLYEDVKNTFLNVPLYAQFSFGGNRLRGFLNAGAYLGAWLKSTREGTINYFYDELDPTGNIEDIEDFYGMYDYDEPVAFDSRRDNRFDWGLLAGVGLRYQFAKRWEALAECRYYHGLSDLQKDYMLQQVARYNNTFSFSAGVLFRFGKTN